MSNRTEATSMILFACLTVGACMAQGQATATGGEQGDPEQQVAPAHPDEKLAGPGPYNFPFRIVYLRKDGEWGKDNCITVFPDPAEIYSGPGKKPNRIWWVVLGKQAGHVWEVIAKQGSDENDLPPYPRKIPKDKPIDSFWTKPVKHKGVDYDWNYDVKLTEEGADCSVEGAHCCKLDPGVRVKG
jgi:hypothetical protein